MSTKSQTVMSNTGKIVLLVCLIVVALGTLVFAYFRSTPSSGTVSAGTRQMKASVRSRKQNHIPSGIGQ